MIGLFPSVFGGPTHGSKHQDAEIELLRPTAKAARTLLGDFDGRVAKDRESARLASSGLTLAPVRLGMMI
jgi:hypothetical protein